MNPIIVWIVVLILMAFVTVLYYTCTPAFIQIINGWNDYFNDVGISGDMQTTWNFFYTVIKYEWIWIVLFFVLGILAWAFLMSQRKDYESYGYEV